MSNPSPDQSLPIQLIKLGEVDSTNLEIRRRATAGVGEGLVVVAEAQRSGRGRATRRWESPVGNLYCSILLSPPVPMERRSELSFVAAVALSETIGGVLPAERQIRCKWPNDLLIDEKKTSGILLEGLPDDQIVLGTGVNVANHPEIGQYPTTSLHKMGARISVDDLLRRYLQHLSHWYGIWRTKGFEPVRLAWLDAAYQLGESITVEISNASVSGRFVTIDERGALILKQESGNNLTINSGDVILPILAGSS